MHLARFLLDSCLFLILQWIFLFFLANDHLSSSAYSVCVCSCVVCTVGFKTLLWPQPLNCDWVLTQISQVLQRYHVIECWPKFHRYSKVTMWLSADPNFTGIPEWAAYVYCLITLSRHQVQGPLAVNLACTVQLKSQSFSRRITQQITIHHQPRAATVLPKTSPLFWPFLWPEDFWSVARLESCWGQRVQFHGYWGESWKLKRKKIIHLVK